MVICSTPIQARSRLDVLDVVARAEEAAAAAEQRGAGLRLGAGVGRIRRLEVPAPKRPLSGPARVEGHDLLPRHQLLPLVRLAGSRAGGVWEDERHRTRGARLRVAVDGERQRARHRAAVVERHRQAERRRRGVRHDEERRRRRQRHR